jgi:hypothetical protein
MPLLRSWHSPEHEAQARRANEQGKTERRKPASPGAFRSVILAGLSPRGHVKVVWEPENHQADSVVAVATGREQTPGWR